MLVSRNIKSLSDEALLTKLKALSITENETTVEVLLHLAEVDARKLYIPRGFSSLFSYCTASLRYSEPAANRRICCARAIVRFPELLELLLTREISLSSLACVANILNEENKERVLEGIRSKSYREIQEFAAKYRPKAMAREEIKPAAILVKAAPFAVTKMPLFERKEPLADRVVAPESSEAAWPIAPVPARKLAPCSAPYAASDLLPNLGQVIEERYEVRFSIKKEVMKKLEEVKFLLSGKYPKGAKLEDILDEALEMLLDKHSPKRREERRDARRASREELALATPPPTSAERAGLKAESRHIPLATRDAVWNRDGGKCGFVGKDGRRCDERRHLEVHHLQPFAVSPSHALENLVLRCRVHNAHEAVLDFGEKYMAKFRDAVPSASTVTRRAVASNTAATK